MTVLVDFDHTLFNTTLLTIRLRQAAASLGVDQEIFKSSYDAVVSQIESQYGYDPAEQANLIVRALGRSELAGPLRKKFQQTLDSGQDYLYPDSIEFLSKLKELGATVILLSRGQFEWQSRKIDSVGIKRLFNRVEITPTSKADLIAHKIRRDDRMIFITDNSSEIEFVKDRLSYVEIIQIIRPEGKYQSRVEGVPFVRNLHEALDYINLKNSQS